MRIRSAQLRVTGDREPADAALRRDLVDAVDGEVRFDDGAKALYATDASNYRAVPIGVVVPRSTEAVLATIDVCRSHGAPIVSRGAGTSLAGQTCNTAVVIDFSKYLNRIIEIDPERRLARVQPGVVLDHLRDAASEHGLTFGPDPATHNRCTFGGMIGNNSCGVHSMMSGRTVDNVESLDVVTYDGTRMLLGPLEGGLEQIAGPPGRLDEIVRQLHELGDRYGDDIRARFPDIPRRVSGYAIDELLPEAGRNIARSLVGSEGTCVTVLEATVRLVPSPPNRVLLLIGYPDVFLAGDDVPMVVEHRPVGLEGIDRMLVDNMRLKDLHAEHLPLLPDGDGWLIVEFGGDTHDEALGKARDLAALLDRSDGHQISTAVVSDPQEQHRVWVLREAGLAATARVPGHRDTWPGWEDAAVPPDRLGEYLRGLRKLYDKYGYDASLYGHFGQGCVHTRIDFDLLTAEGIAAFRSFIDEAADLTIGLGGSLSGEHGDGQARAELLPKMYGERLVGAFREFKRIWDPDGKMNPGKVVDARPATADLRLGTDYDPPRARTWFQFPHDDGDFSRATQRCVGVGECRRSEGGVMCPSYMVTMEEEHSTRGRAHLLFEMLSGRGVVDGWRDPHVKESLDLCLSCKGCKGECPVGVDVATYKAEFLAHYWRGRLRPRAAYAMGLIMYWLRAAAIAPRAASAGLSLPGAERAMKALGGVAQPRSIPRPAAQPFTRMYQPAKSSPGNGQPVLLWPDTFSNYLRPQTAMAAVEVLEAAGYRVVLPSSWVCCGRPLYDFGFLSHARRLLRRTLRTLEDEIRAGLPIVVLEPSCLSVFREELPNLLPHDRDATRLARQSHLLSEFLEQRAPDLDIPRLDRDALVQLHCHHSSVLDFEAEHRVLERLGLNTDVVEGCCGMAGAFGFERDKYDVSMACGERALLPAARDAPDDTLIVANGFSCREQVEQATGRTTVHLAEVLQTALRRRTA